MHANQSYVGQIPDMKYYDRDGMSASPHQKFEMMYQEQVGMPVSTIQSCTQLYWLHSCEILVILGDITVSKSTVGAKYCLLSESQWFPLYRFPYFLQPVSDFPKFKKVFHSFSVTVQLGTKLLRQLSHLTRKNLI